MYDKKADLLDKQAKDLFDQGLLRQMGLAKAYNEDLKQASAKFGYPVEDFIAALDQYDKNQARAQAPLSNMASPDWLPTGRNEKSDWIPRGIKKRNFFSSVWSRIRFHKANKDKIKWVNKEDDVKWERREDVRYRNEELTDFRNWDAVKNHDPHDQREELALALEDLLQSKHAEQAEGAKQEQEDAERQAKQERFAEPETKAKEIEKIQKHLLDKQRKMLFKELKLPQDVFNGERYVARRQVAIDEARIKLERDFGQWLLVDGGFRQSDKYYQLFDALKDEQILVDRELAPIFEARPDAREGLEALREKNLEQLELEKQKHSPFSSKNH